jgi:hypothetical protein
MNYFMVSTHGGATEWSGSNKPATFRFSTIHVDKYETFYISVNSERGLHFTAQLKHVVIVISDELWQENGYANTFHSY